VCLVFQAARVDPADRRSAALPLVHGLMAGVGGAFATGDLFNLYVWFEVMLIAALGLLVHRGASPRWTARCAIWCSTWWARWCCSPASRWCMAPPASSTLRPWPRRPRARCWRRAWRCWRWPSRQGGGVSVFSWMPAAYHVLPAPILALFAGLLSKVGVYALLRLFGQVFPAAMADWQAVLGAVAVATMLAGALGAAWHWDLRRILAFHIVSQIGYLILAVALVPRPATRRRSSTRSTTSS
jgi:multicomponent Na+:H+ antiporter subunit D